MEGGVGEQRSSVPGRQSAGAEQGAVQVTLFILIILSRRKFLFLSHLAEQERKNERR